VKGKRIMVYRALALLLVALGLALFAGTPVPADETRKTDDAKTVQQRHLHEGTVVSVTADKLVMKGKAKDGEEGKEHSHKLADKAKVTCDGKECKLEDLKVGQKIRVTTKGDDRVMATRVEALDKNERFPKGDGSETEKKERDKNQP
jgi:hypothetical protein